MRLAWPLAGGALVIVLGTAGLVRAAVPESVGHASTSTMPASAPIVVTGAFVRAPVPPTHVSAAYFTVHNTTGTPDRLEAVTTGAGPSAELHVDAPDGSMKTMTGGVVIPAHGSLVLSTGHGHVMIEGVYPSVQPGQSVNIDLEFSNAGSIDVVAPVISFAAAAPTAGNSSGGGHS